jgi:hypothetical protein
MAAMAKKSSARGKAKTRSLKADLARIAEAEGSKPARGTKAKRRRTDAKKTAAQKRKPLPQAPRDKSDKSTNPNFFAHAIQPGEVRNPRGLNQYTYRRDAEQTFARILKSARSDRRKGTISEEILEIIMTMAQNKDRWALERVLERILPKIEKHIHEDEPDADRLASELASLIARG